VGHVLEKVDGRRDPRLRDIQRRAFEEWKRSKPKPVIFWGFIEDVRNSVIKEYEFGIGSWARAGPGVRSVTAEDRAGTRLTVAASDEEGAQINFFRTGPFAGRSQLHVAKEAFEWWRCHLDALDSNISRA
jgi:hypothetical protein